MAGLERIAAKPGAQRGSQALMLLLGAGLQPGALPDENGLGGRHD